MKMTVKDLIDHKGKGQLTELNVASVEHSAAAEAAGIEIIVSGRKHARDDFRAAAPNTHFTFGLIYGEHANADEAKRAAFEAMEAGADSVYSPMHYNVIEAMAKEAIPVVGHIGFMPQKARWTGYAARGKTADDALAILNDARRYQDAGAFAVEIEIVPPAVAAAISRRTSLVVISMGSGAGCDVQYLFSVDVLGETEGHVPRHARVYRDFRAEYARLQQDRVAAFSEFRRDVASGSFPDESELVQISDEELNKFETALENWS